MIALNHLSPPFYYETITGANGLYPCHEYDTACLQNKIFGTNWLHYLLFHSTHRLLHVTCRDEVRQQLEQSDTRFCVEEVIQWHRTSPSTQTRAQKFTYLHFFNNTFRAASHGTSIRPVMNSCPRPALAGRTCLTCSSPMRATSSLDPWEPVSPTSLTRLSTLGMCFMPSTLHLCIYLCVCLSLCATK